MLSKIRPHKITFTAGEGIAGSMMKGKIFTSYEDANLALASASRFSPKPGRGYDKISFVVEFKDGFIYTGRLDLEDGNYRLNDHVKQYLAFMSGQRRPECMEEDQYQSLLESFGGPDKFREILDHYTWDY